MKKYLRIIALVLSTMLIVSTLPTPSPSIVFAAQVEKKNVNQDNKSTNDSQKSSKLKPFTSSEDLVAAMEAELLQKGNSNTVKKGDQDLQTLSDTLEKKCGYTLTEVKSFLAIHIFRERDQDVIDVSEYNLSEDEIKIIIDLVLKDYCATDSIKVSVNVDKNGIAQSISVDMNSGFEAGLDALDEMEGVGEIYPATEKVEENETATASTYAKSAAQSDASLDETTETPTTTPEVTGTVPPTATPEVTLTEAPSITPEVTVTVTPTATPGTHTYGEPTFTWSEINIEAQTPYSCTAKFICGDCNEESIVECKVTRDEVQTDAIIYIATCQFEDIEYSTTRDATTEQLYAHWGKLCTFYGQNAEYYGVSAEYWTAKTTKNNPFGALKVLAGFDVDTPVPAPNMDELIAGITQAFQAYVYYYGDALLAARAEALSGIDDNMTDLQKCLVLHDYLSTHAVFDMATLMNFQNEQKQSDPITMTPFGALLYGKIDGINGCVCLGYATTYTYLVQSAFPEIYRDENNAFKSYEEVFESGKDMVDFVMIKYDCDVTEVGVTHGEGGFTGRFTEPHYYNVVKLDGQWYNVDVCYDDIKTETLTQYRVETDGNLSHMYFLVSNQTIEDWYEGYYEYIDTLHGTGSEEPCDSEQYEDAWFSNIDCPISYDDEYWYFVEAQFSDLDLIDMMSGEDGNSGLGETLADMDSEELAELMKDNADQMKLRPRTAGDLSNDEGIVLIDYGKGNVYNLKTNETTEGLLEEDCDDDIQISNIYPDLTHSVSLYNNELYFNLDNKIYMYNLDDGTVTQIKEYNTVYANSNGTPFTGSSFYITDAQDENLKYTVNNHPLAALCIKDDGIMYVSVATNYSNSECSKYEKESVNFNVTYNRFAKEDANEDSEETEDENDNSEFMWCANIKDNINMSDVATYLSDGSELENEVVDSWCNKQGYTESREIAHGFSSGTDKTNLTDAKEHHYIFTEEEGCYICSRCYKALETEKAEEQGIVVGHTYGEPVFNWEELEDGGYQCTATFTCDFEDDVQTVDATVTSQAKDEEITYTATCNFNQKTYSDTKTIQVSEQPSPQPSPQPSEQPSPQPSEQPSPQPSEQPSPQPSEQPSPQPTTQPTGTVVIPPIYVPVNIPITNLQIVNKDVKLAKNQSIPLELQITPSDATETELKFTSSNNAIATVTKEGVVTGLQEGTAIITVSTADGRLTKSVTVEVGKLVTSIELDLKELNLLKSETSLLSATLAPDNAVVKKVQFISQDESIATVDAIGNVTAVGVGTTQIIAKSMDGGEITATCLITVKQKVTKLSISSIAAQSFTGKAIKPKVILKDGDYQLKNGKDYSLTWKNNKNIGTAIITIVGKGNYTGTKKITFAIKPSKPLLSSVKSSKSTTAVATWDSVKGVSGYQVYYTTSLKGSYKSVGTTSKTSYTITKLESESTIYVKVRAYKIIDGKKVYGAYSNVITLKVK